MHEPEFVPPSNAETPDDLTRDTLTGDALTLESAFTPDLSTSPSNPLGLGKQVAPWWHTILFLLILIGISVLGAFGAKKQQMVGHQMANYISTIVLEWLMLAFVWWGLRLRRIPLKSMLGVRHKGWSGLGRDLAYAAVFWVIAYFVLDATALLLKYVHVGKSSPPGKVLALAPGTPFEFFMWFLVCATAGFCEELIFRGYFLRQFSSIGGKLSLRGKIWIGVVLSSIVFGMSHGYEGISVMIVIFIFGVLFCLLALKSKSLRPGMFAHGWHDFFTGIAIAVLHHFHHLPH